MRNTSFGSVFQMEVLLNSKRISPYAMAILFSVNALLWWGWGAAVHYGWATNGDYYIGRNFGGFSIGTLPLFTAIFMGGAVTRDYRLRIDPLIFSKPIGRTSYLLGKFFGNFFVLVCCQSVFMLTLVLLQGASKSSMVVQPWRVIPYFKAFIIIVLIPHLVLAAFYFTVGTLTRDSKFVYGLAIFFYPLYIAAQVLLLKNLSNRWRIALDPFYSMVSGITWKDWTNAQMINQYVYTLGADKIANCVIMLSVSAVCLGILCLLFKREEHDEGAGGQDQTQLGLSEYRESLYGGEVSSRPSPEVERENALPREKIALPQVETSTQGFRAHLRQLTAALSVEFRLLRAERSLLLLAPLTVFASTMGLSYYQVSRTNPFSATYASSTADTVVVFLLGLTMFYTGETMHRDRETRVEPLLWSFPVPNHVLLLAKFLAMVTLSFALMVLVGLTAITLQLLRGDTPVEISAYLLVYSVILTPSIFLAAGLSIALNVLLRDKYLTYAVSLAIAGGLFYLYGLGHNHWLYNPLLYQRWTYADLTGATGGQSQILVHRVYCLAILCLSLSLALLAYQRQSAKGLLVEGRLNSRGWSILLAFISVATAALAGLKIVSLAR
jgi:ABC-type transport system involved in multi-copper enzyme maturation permease subunit